MGRRAGGRRRRVGAARACGMLPNLLREVNKNKTKQQNSPRSSPPPSSSSSSTFSKHNLSCTVFSTWPCSGSHCFLQGGFLNGLPDCTWPQCSHPPRASAAKFHRRTTGQSGIYLGTLLPCSFIPSEFLSLSLSSTPPLTFTPSFSLSRSLTRSLVSRCPIMVPSFWPYRFRDCATVWPRWGKRASLCTRTHAIDVHFLVEKGYMHMCQNDRTMLLAVPLIIMMVSVVFALLVPHLNGVLAAQHALCP